MNEITGSSLTELMYGSMCGLAYGLVHPLVGQPLDSIKTLAQQPAHRGASMRAIAAHTMRDGGVRAFYRGLSGPLVGSVVFRSLQFGIYSGAYAWCGEHESLRWTQRRVPGTDVQWRVLLGALTAGTVRSVIETPLEAYKVRKQMKMPFAARDALSGFTSNWFRTCTLLTSFFVFVDISGRHMPSYVADDPVLAPLFKGGVCATGAWILCWPFEIAKNQIQAQAPGPNTLFARLRYMVREEGARAFSRGLAPGVLRSIFANGTSFFVYLSCQRNRDRILNVNNRL